MPRQPLLLFSVALMMVFAVAADLGWRAYTRPQFVVSVNGLILGAVRNPSVAMAALEAVKAGISTEAAAHANLTDRLQVEPILAKRQISIVKVEDIEQALIQTLPALVDAIAITADDRDIVAVADATSAQTVRDSILEEYKATILRGATAIEQVKFQESIGWHKKLVKRENVRTIEEAINILKLGTDKLATYLVKEGDTGWDIAHSYNVTTDDLEKANPAVDLYTLQIGQKLNVTFKEPYVHTQSISKRIVDESIPFTEEVVKNPDLWPWQYEVVTPGTPGVRRLTVREYRENGQVVKSDVLANEVLRRPQSQVSRQGTRQVPRMGTGALVYPVVGTLTSTFGPRWGTFHPGIDIAAPSGTPVLAADSGMVVETGWYGNYGNMIVIDHGGGKLITKYAHLLDFRVARGDTVTKGQVIGYVGSTGFSTGPHLHYEVYVDGELVNPLNFYQ